MPELTFATDGSLTLEVDQNGNLPAVNKTTFGDAAPDLQIATNPKPRRERVDVCTADVHTAPKSEPPHEFVAICR